METCGWCSLSRLMGQGVTAESKGFPGFLRPCKPKLDEHPPKKRLVQPIPLRTDRFLGFFVGPFCLSEVAKTRI